MLSSCKSFTINKHVRLSICDISWRIANSVNWHKCLRSIQGRHCLEYSRSIRNLLENLLQADGKKSLFLGMEFCFFVSHNGMKNWNCFADVLPNFICRLNCIVGWLNHPWCTCIWFTFDARTAKTTRSILFKAMALKQQSTVRYMYIILSFRNV